MLLVRLAIALLALSVSSMGSSAASVADTAKQCLRAAYLLHPYKRPGAAPMNGGRLFFYKECLAKHSDAASDLPK